MVESITVNGTIVPPKLTEVTFFNFLPIIVTVSWEPAVAGEKEIISGPVNLKSAFVATPPAVANSTFPLDPDPTYAISWVGDTESKEAAGIPPNVTDVAP